MGSYHNFDWGADYRVVRASHRTNIDRQMPSNDFFRLLRTNVVETAKTGKRRAQMEQIEKERDRLRQQREGRNKGNSNAAVSVSSSDTVVPVKEEHGKEKEEKEQVCLVGDERGEKEDEGEGMEDGSSEIDRVVLKKREKGKVKKRKKKKGREVVEDEEKEEWAEDTGEQKRRKKKRKRAEVEDMDQKTTKEDNGDRERGKKKRKRERVGDNDNDKEDAGQKKHRKKKKKRREKSKQRVNSTDDDETDGKNNENQAELRRKAEKVCSKMAAKQQAKMSRWEKELLKMIKKREGNVMNASEEEQIRLLMWAIPEVERRKLERLSKKNVDVSGMEGKEEEGEEEEAASESVREDVGSEGNRATAVAPEEKGNASNPKEQDRNRDYALEDERVQRTVFIGNLHPSTTVGDVERLLKPFGTIETTVVRSKFQNNRAIDHWTLLCARRLLEHRSCIAAYAVFSEEQPEKDTPLCLRKACLTLNMTILKDRVLRVRPAVDVEMKEKLSVVVGGLPYDVRETELVTVFEPLAKRNGCLLTNVRRMEDKNTGVCKGVAFVTFNDDGAVLEAVKQSGKLRLRGRPVRVEHATKVKKMNTATYRFLKKKLQRQEREAQRLGQRLGSDESGVQYRHRRH